MTYIVHRRLTVGGHVYEPGDRIEGAELQRREGHYATRGIITLVSQAEAQRSAAPDAAASRPPTAGPQMDRTRGRS